MSTYLMMVLTNPTEGNEDRFNDWYDNVHIGEVLELPDFNACQRFRVRGGPVMGEAGHKYLAIYEIESENPENAIAGLLEAVNSQMTLTDALDMDTVSSSVFEAIGPRILK